MNRILRWGLLGAGAIARDFARDLAFARTGRLEAVGSRSETTAQNFAAQFPGCRTHGSYEALCADPEIDVVYVATPHPFHAVHAIATLEAGKHVLCEKPFTMSAAEAEQVFAAARAANRFVMEAFKDRCHPLLTTVIDALPRLGEVRMIDATFSFAATFDPHSRLFAKSLGGGGILDLGCYPVAYARRIVGATLGRHFADPTEFTGAATLSPVTGTDLFAAATMRFENGVLARVSCGVGVSQENLVRIHGRDGEIVIPVPWARHPAGTQHATLNLHDGREELLSAAADRPIFALEADVVGAAIAAGRLEAEEMSWADTLGNMRVLDAWRSTAR